MEREETTDMIWTETKSLDERRTEIRKYIENRFKEIYPFREIKNKVVFLLPDGFEMSLFSMGGLKFDCLGMNYTNSQEDDDGDLYSIDDYETANELFNDMLEETRR